MAGSALRRLARDRLAMFFVVLLPVVIIAIIGITFGDAGSERVPVGVVDEGAGPLGADLRSGLAASGALDPRAYEDADALRKAVRRGVVAAGVVLPAGYDQGLRTGRDAEVTFVVDQTRPAPAPVRSAVAAAVARQGAQVRAARFAAQEAGVPFDTALARARALSDAQPQVRVAAATVGGRTDALPSGFNYTAPAALLLTVTFALVATGVGMLGGSVLRNAEQATSIGPPVGIALGMLGGCMWPLAIVPEPMRVLGHLFPQAWAMDAFIALIARNTGLGGITRELAVLAAFAAVLLALAVWRLRRTLVG